LVQELVQELDLAPALDVVGLASVVALAVAPRRRCSQWF